MTKNGWAGRAAVVIAAATLGLAGCGDNAGNPVSFAPEGQVSEALLLLSTVPAAADSSALFLIAQVLSPPPANGFRLYLNPGNEGYRPASDAPVTPAITLTSGWSLYSTVVDGYRPELDSYVQARGARDGIESSAAPLTNVAFVAAAPAINLLRLGDVALGLPNDSTTVNARPTLNWQAVPGAGRYVVQLVNASGGILYAALTTTNSHQISLGSGLILQEFPLLDGGYYLWNVQAFDSGSRLIAASRASRSFFVEIPPIPPIP